MRYPSFRLLITKPLPHYVAFSGRQIKYICDLSICGDLLEVTNKLGVSPSNCISCEFPIPNPNTDQGAVDSIQLFDNFGEVIWLTKSNEYQKRSKILSELFSEKFRNRAKNLRGKKRTILRKEFHKYIRKATHSESFKKVIKSDFHPMKIMPQRILRKYLTSCRLAAAHLLHNGYVTNNQKAVYDSLKSLNDELREKKQKSLKGLQISGRRSLG